MAMVAAAWLAAVARAKKDNVKPGMLTEERRRWLGSSTHGDGGEGFEMAKL